MRLLLNTVECVFIAFLLAFKTNRKGTADSMTEPFAGIFGGMEAMTHPPSGGAIATNIREAPFVATVRRAERNFFDCLIHY